MRFLGWDNLKLFALPQRNRDGFYELVLESWCWFETQKKLGVTNSIVLFYLSDLYFRGSELQQVMAARIGEMEFSILSLGTFSRFAQVGVVEWLSVYRMITSCKSRGTILRILSLLIKEWFSFGLLRPLDRTETTPVLALVVVARLCEVNWSLLRDQSWSPYEYDDSMLIILNCAAALKRVMTDGTEEWQDCGGELCSM